MKTKTFTKKLDLNKKTIAHLDNEKMRDIYAGAQTRPTKCPITSCERTCTC
jgi:hypothetical protein